MFNSQIHYQNSIKHGKKLTKRKLRHNTKDYLKKHKFDHLVKKIFIVTDDGT